MADYKKMYTGLCAAVDDSITVLEAILRRGERCINCKKRWRMPREIYIQTSLCANEDGADIAARRL